MDQLRAAMDRFMQALAQARGRLAVDDRRSDCTEATSQYPFIGVGAMAKPGDYIVCLGAGSITQWAYALPAELAAVAN